MYVDDEPLIRRALGLIQQENNKREEQRSPVVLEGLNTQT